LSRDASSISISGAGPTFFRRRYSSMGLPSSASFCVPDGRGRFDEAFERGPDGRRATLDHCNWDLMVSTFFVLVSSGADPINSDVPQVSLTKA
jgi:hypothetical protein